MESSVYKIMSPEKLLDHILSILETVSPDFPIIKKEYTESLTLLRNHVGKEKVKNLLCAITRRNIVDLLFCSNLGYEANRKNFIDPVARTFLDVDPDTYLRINLLHVIPERVSADEDIRVFRQSLRENEKEIFASVISYLLLLEQELPRLAHYTGFMLANKLLIYTEPGYTPNLILSLHYKNKMESYLGRKIP